ncbi:glycosyltransferase family 4 protein [Telluribacter sp.]|jgi:glycosyltransferase involved in cell wall biosynthesis|uniref:glycosyltransferase family 4 protein n=1 Tax=Telluribacter sp. TaxID=1978767 RepID=UPI002E123C71|nr:glycosyltransferase family 4 protein [Telluribacter sp.]
MKKQRLRILFLTPYAGRTGSEMMLLYILKSLDREKFQAGLVCFAQGELLQEVPADVPVFLAPLNYNLWQKASYWAGRNPTKACLKQIQNNFKADVWYINTIMLPEAVAVAKELHIPFITHVHELTEAFSYTGKSDFRSMVEDSALLIGCSDIACQRLREAGAKKVRRVYSFVDLDKIAPSAAGIAAARAEWGAGPDDFVWIFSGVSSDLKGFGLLPDIASRIQGQNVHVVWMGNLLDSGLVYYVENRCRAISNVKIHLIGSKNKDYYSYLAAADGLVIASRQESFGLVMVEAARLGKPVVAFDCGGPAEFISPEIGTLVPNLNIDKLVDTMFYWQHNASAYNHELAQQRAMRFGNQEGMQEWTRVMEEFSV